MTWVLDGAKFRKVVDLGSPSLYGVAFDRPDGQHVLALWTIRGHRPLQLKFKSAAGAVSSRHSPSAVSPLVSAASSSRKPEASGGRHSESACYLVDDQANETVLPVKDGASKSRSARRLCTLSRPGRTGGHAGRHAAL